MTDCLIIGFNETNFQNGVEMIKYRGIDSATYRELNLHFIEHNGTPYRSIDILNRFHLQHKAERVRPFHNSDFLLPVVMHLGSYLSKRELTFDYVNLFHFEKDKLRGKLLNDNILTIAITTTLYVTPHPIWDILLFIKKYNTTAKIIIGGPYILNQSRILDQIALGDLFKYLGADFYVISSEGEASLADIILALKQGIGFSHISNIACKNSGTYTFTDCLEQENPLEESMVNYSLFPQEDFNEFMLLRTAKSCPFTCAFCGFSERGGKYRYLSVDLVEKELNTIQDLGSVTSLTFIDDTFNIPPKRFKEILRMMIKNKYKFRWNCYYRCDHGDEETIELMKEAGCEGVFLGVESGSNDILKKMNKTAKREDYLKAIPKLGEVGITTYTSLIVGFPGETYQTIQETIELIEEAKPDFFRAQLWYCDPITPIYREKEKYGIKGTGFEWSHNTMDAKTACALAEKIFLSVKNSTWLPQNGFELQSVFYLQRKGMTLLQIKDFLNCFNAIVKEQLGYLEKKTIAPDLLANLMLACQFDKQD